MRWAFTLGALGICNPVGARELTPALELNWSAPAGCPDRNAARAAIEAALALDHADRGKAMNVRVKIVESEPGRWLGEIWMYDAGSSGERSIEGAECKQVADAITLVVALALDASSKPKPERKAAPTAKREEGPRIALEIGVTGDVGSLPHPDPGIALIAGLRYQRLSLELQGTAWLPRSVQVGSVGGRFQLYTGAARGCVDLVGSEPDGLQFGPCLTAELGGLIGSGTGLAHPEHENVLWVSALAGAFIRHVLAPPVLGTLHVDLGVPFRRPAWQIAELGPIFRPEPVVWRLLLGLGWSFR